MQVIVLVKANKASEEGQMPSQELMTKMGAFNQELINAGIMLNGAGLEASSKGKRMRFSGPAPLVTDGPFAETKELVSGFWIWKVESMEQAVELAKRAPFPPELLQQLPAHAWPRNYYQ